MIKNLSHTKMPVFQFLPLLLMILSFIACDRAHRTEIKRYDLIRSDLELGEYVKVISEDEVITVNRSPNSELKGLVKVNLKSSHLVVLDPDAREARDIYVSGTVIVYRLNNQLKISMDGSLASIEQPIERIRGLASSSQGLLKVFVDISKNNFAILDISSEGVLVGKTKLQGSVRATTEGPGQSLLVLWQQLDGLFLGELARGRWTVVPIEMGRVGEYATMKIVGQDLIVAYFDETLGLLKSASKNLNHGNFLHEVIDGVVGKTYRGLDPAIGDFDGKPVLFYLDGWKLKLRMAIKDNNSWKTQELPINGALGFYTQIIKIKNSVAHIVFHNFRSDSTSTDPSFEDLSYSEIFLQRP